MPIPLIIFQKTILCLWQKRIIQEREHWKSVLLKYFSNSVRFFLVYCDVFRSLKFQPFQESLFHVLMLVRFYYFVRCNIFFKNSFYLISIGRPGWLTNFRQRSLLETLLCERSTIFTFLAIAKQRRFFYSTFLR